MTCPFGFDPGAGQPGPGATVGDWRMTSLRKMYVWVSTFAESQPVLNAAARTVVVLSIVIGPV